VHLLGGRLLLKATMMEIMMTRGMRPGEVEMKEALWKLRILKLGRWMVR